MTMNVEGSHWTSESDEASDDSEENKKQKKDDKSANNKFRVPIFARNEITPNERRDFAAEMMRQKATQEALIKSAENDDDTEDDEDDKEKTEESDESNASDAGVEVPAEGQNEIAEFATEESVGEPQSEVFETITQPQDEIMDIPHVDVDKPSIDLTESENKTFSEIAASLGGFGEESKKEAEDEKDVPPIPSWDMPTKPHPLGANETRAVSPEPVAGPSATTESKPSGYGGDYSPPAPSARSGGEVSAGFAAALEGLRAVAGLAELAEAASNPNRFVARVLTRVALEGYMAGRKTNESDALRKQKEALQRLDDEQRRANERLAAQKPKGEPVYVDEYQRLVDADGNVIPVPTGLHFERGVGGYLALVNNRGEVIHDVLPRGEAFQHDRQRESISDDIFAKIDAEAAASTEQHYGDGAGVQQFGQFAHQNQNLISQPQTADPSHRLPESTDRRVRNSVSVPWLLIAIAVIIIIYFVAQLA